MWVWENSGSWWWTGKLGMLQSMGSQRVRHDWAIEPNWTYFYYYCCSDAQLCPTLCDPVDCSLPDSSVHGILQARILEWVAMPSSRGSSWPRDWTWVSYIVINNEIIIQLTIMQGQIIILQILIRSVQPRSLECVVYSKVHTPMRI